MKALNISKNNVKMLSGPPFANAPRIHYGHLINGILKDVILGFNKSLGHNVEGTDIRFDVHGLPIEQKVQEMIKEQYGYDDVKTIVDKLGLGEYNRMAIEFCKGNMSAWPDNFKEVCPTLTCKGESTLDFTYMNNLWTMFHHLHTKGLVYQGNKVQPYSADLETCISNFEAKQNYKSVTERTVYVTFPLVEPINDRQASLIVWTTTPYTLFSNTALCINENLKYKMFENNNGNFICSEYFFNATITKDKSIKATNVIDITTDQLKGATYSPIFDMNPTRYYKVVWDDYVKSDTGTGVVHLAASYGQDDYRVCEKFGIVTKTGEGCWDPTDSRMQFTNVVYDEFVGREARSCNGDIIRLINSMSRLFCQTTTTHELPHCWRTDKPLYYKMMPSINIDIETLRPQLLKALETINFPQGIGKDRMQDSIEKAPDWCVSRTRLWGTPIPIWQSADGEQIVIRDAEELEILAGMSLGTLTDLHTDRMPQTITVEDKEYKWCNYTLDVWFESGAQWLAQDPNGKDHIDDVEYMQQNYVANFILEGMDQTRGWFYTLLVLSVSIMQKNCYQNIIINGILLDKHGIKFSKRLKNYRDINELITEYGIDAVRLYLLASPASKGETLKFDDEHIKDWNRSVTIPLSNTLNLFTEYYRLFRQENPDIELVDIQTIDITKLTDVNTWILVKFRKFINNIIDHVNSYKLFKIGDYIVEFIQELNNGYCKFNRNSIKGKSDDWQMSLSVLSYVITNLSIVLENIIPKTSRKLREGMGNVTHHKNITNIPLITITESNQLTVNKVDLVFKQIYSVLTYRGSKNLTTKYPIAKVIFGLQPDDMRLMHGVNHYNSFICEETNVLEVEYQHIDSFTEKSIKSDVREIGRTFRTNKDKVLEYISKNKQDIINDYESTGLHTTAWGDLTNVHLNIMFEYQAMEDYDLFNDNDITVYIATERSERLNNLYLARYFATQIQNYRKQNGIKVTDTLDIRYNASENYHKIIEANQEYIENILVKKIQYLDEDSRSEYLSKVTYEPLKIETESVNATVYILKL